MQAITSFLLCCIVCGRSFSQVPGSNDSSKNIPVITHEVEKTNLQKRQPGLSIFPNPAKNKITVQVKNFNPGMVSVKVLDLRGKLVKDDMRLLTNGNEDIIMFLMLKAGIYFILVSAPGKEAKRKLVVL